MRPSQQAAMATFEDLSRRYSATQIEALEVHHNALSFTQEACTTGLQKD